jgi:Zn-dependent protease with chaperone function
MFYLIFLLIAGFLIGFSYPTGFELPYFYPVVTICLCFLLVFAYIAFGLFTVAKYLNQIKANPAPEVIKKYRRWSFAYRSSILVIYAIQLYLLNWPLVITYWAGLDNILFVTNFLVIFPFLAIYILSFLPFHKMDCYFRQSNWTLIEYLIFQVRSYFLLVISPPLIFIFYADLIQYWQAFNELIYVYPFIEWFITLGFMLVLYAVSPFFLKIIWGLKPLPEGALRKRLQPLIYKTGVTIRDIMVWPIGAGKMANAMVVGLLPKWRYIIFTDTLLNNLSEEEIESVFAHEVGHIKQAHLFIYIVIFIGYFELAITLEQLLNNIFNGGGYLIEVNLLLFMAAYWIFIFGFVSRRLEHQADLFGSLITNNFNGFTNALQKIASLNAMASSEKSLQHPSIEKRINFLLAAQGSKDYISQFVRHIKKVTYIVLAISVVAMIGWFWSIDNQFGKAARLKWNFNREALINQISKKADKLVKDKKYKDARQIVELLIGLRPNNYYFYILLGDAQSEGKNILPPEAIKSYKKAQSLGPKDTINRIYLREKLTAK